ncbi:class I SAM-dependent methyltransferase [Azospirillum sp. ST 5-10]|uniref:class I SAM-dependent methyltransferase n=2 Tax=unclassified Azospirillum TaxID=2630922 RepID=UPI003F49D22E
MTKLVPNRMRGTLRTGLRQLRRVALLVEDGPSFACPCCGYEGKFLSRGRNAEAKPYAQCPKCGALGRHRLQRCVLDDLFRSAALSGGRVLHFAPEPFLAATLKERFETYVGADIRPLPGQVRADMRSLQFDSATFDLVYASHVLEHIDDDAHALAEVRRVLRPGGVAILPVPVVAERTVEYPEPCASEHGHVRAPGRDYYDRYKAHFARVEIKTSADYAERFQLYAYEDRTIFPNAAAPYRPPMAGDRHELDVPVCYA